MPHTMPRPQARYQVEPAQARPGFAWITDTQASGPLTERAILFFGTAQEAAQMAEEWNALSRYAQALWLAPEPAGAPQC